MSESLLFAILGFLVACLLGTVFASFLWRRAVTVTTRKIAEDENFAGLDEVADLKADLRAAQNTIGSKDREIGEAAAKTADLEAAIAEAKASGEGAAENLKQELQNADAALDTAHGERDAAKAALASKEEEIKAAEGRTEAAQERVAELENAIRTLVKETSLFETSTPKQPPLEAKKLEAKPLTSPAMSPNADGDTEDNTKPVATEATSKADEEDTPEPSLAISRSLEERIEALKQGESTSA
jgi:chromosome segregation ATPase|tara:strand:+ start:2202 stop:2927 length:726 start_codon:yes stop_codon:yes gene_type:complete